ncbi:MAG: DUF4340 domain-containing protein [Sinobacteraceae bacterium]|nr:DUF4340 domain-containing protein [Nevskiaceae bacterium]
MKRKILNLVMLVVVIVLAVGVYLATQKKAKPPKPPLTALNSATIDAISIKNPGHKTLALKRKDGQWKITSPFKAVANNANVNSILSVATSACQSEIKPAEVTLSKLGLKPPKYSILFNKTRVDVGMVEPLKYRRYAMVGDKICLISNPSAPGLGSQSYANLVSTALVPPGKTLVKIEIPGYTASLDNSSGKWSLTPTAPKAAKDAANILATAWKNTHAMWNATTPANTKPPDNTHSATLHFKDGSSEQFLVVARKPQLKLRRSDIGIDFTVSKAKADKLLQLATPKPAPGSSTSTPAAAASAAAD